MFTWCRQEERYLPSFRCLICRVPCEARNRRVQDETIDQLVTTGKIKEYYVMTAKPSSPKSLAAKSKPAEPSYFLLENGKLKPFSPNDYSAAILYEAVETFTVERRFVKPEEKQDLLFEGRKPTKKTLPLLVSKENGDTLLGSWEDLESNPEQLSVVEEVIAAKPVKQVFVLKRK